MQIDFPKDVSTRISMLRPMLIIGVVFVHVAGIADIPSQVAPGIFNHFAAFFKNGVFRGTVPTMSLIAGFLLFKAGLDQYPARLFKKKFLTLALPFVIFNFYCLAFMAAMHAFFDDAFPVMTMFAQAPVRLLSAFFGIDDYPINGPLHFVRDMMVVMIMVPMLGLFIRCFPIIGLISLAIFFGNNMDGLLIFRASSLILFYIGGIAAVYRWNVLALDRFAKPCLALLIAICMAYTFLEIDDSTFLVVVLPFLIWPAAAMLQHTKIETWAVHFCKYSFFIFVAHMPIIQSFWWVVSNHARWIPYPIYWFAAPALTVAILKLTYDLAMRIAPRAFNLAIGARAAAPALVNRRRVTRPVDAPIYSPALRAALAAR